MRTEIRKQDCKGKEGNETEIQEVQDKKWHVHCPVCGCKLGRSNLSDSDIECHKCHSMIGILVSNGIVTVVDKTEYADAERRRRAAAYMEKFSRIIAGA